ncbi:hypothetical protein Ocin01_11109 [Orchesella cincta]|uniref:Uncharacterized protein n=1 Tax=Orchesella cincta TaxID=48709 RepID=A0A1D2MR93_ORCCI|nr:hypothetical protein Ocin01_11109 [Orchesella cincta]
MDQRFNKDEYFQAARVACDNAFPRSSRRLNVAPNDKSEDKKGKSSTEMEKPLARSMSRLSPALAAAMLSLPWPPSPVVPENSRTELPESTLDLEEKVRESKSSKSRKGLLKKKSKKSYVRVDRDDEKNYDYLPFHIPRFHEVHTSWPGFDHEPVPNWQEKYAIAKPFPRKLEDVSLHVLSQPSSTTMNNNNNLPSLKPAKKSRSKSEKGTTKYVDESRHSKSKSKPRQRVNIERIGGSCIK